MWKNSKEFLKLKNEWKDWKEQIVDIFVFGSLVRGKRKPNDVDVCLVFRSKIDLKLVRKAEEILGKNYHVSSLTVDNFFTQIHSLAKTLLLEGKSLISGKGLAENFGLTSKLVYIYDLSGEEPSKKVRFVYLLRGRGKDRGLVKKWGGEFISKNAFMVSIEADDEVKEVLDRWAVKYRRKRLLLMG